MSAEDYRRYANECFMIAGTVNDSQQRLWLVGMAQLWSRLAEQAEKNAAADLVYETPSLRPAVQQTQQQQQIQSKKDE